LLTSDARPFLKIGVMIAMRQMSGIDDNVKDTVNNHDKGDANDAASSFRTRGGSLSGPALADVSIYTVASTQVLE